MDYRNIKRVIIGHIRDNTGRPVILQASNDEQPAYPFCAYTLTSPYLPKSSAEYNGELIEDVEVVFSFTWHSNDATEVQTLSHDTAMLFKLAQHRQTLSDQGIVFVKIEGLQSRDTFLSVDNERRYGIDIRFRVRNIETFGGELIDTVEIPQ
ncbi:phage neck terminator protein [Exiguobacterium sp. R-39]|uniref:phage neck terminator protein n=1 Tax=Exiguobacterium sp. R-39 TaxID=3416708 RepID=UPI003CF44CAF